MPPTIKENETSAVRPEAAQRLASSATLTGDSANRQQPVALEVPVTVNGARSIDGSDKREPFSETTKTVLIFGNGAVIRLASSVAPGQLLFLTNEKTKKEVVCQVVKSKNYRNVSGYVELEFTEPVVGFWGMRFPGDRIGSVTQVAVPSSVAASSSSGNGSPAISRPVVPTAPKAPTAPIPAAPKVEELLAQKPVAPVAPLSSTLSTSFDPEAPLSLRPTAPPATVTPIAPVSPLLSTPLTSVNLAAALSSTTPPAPTAPEAALPAAPEFKVNDSPRASESQASFLEPPKAPAAGSMASVTNLLSLFEGKPTPSTVDPQPAVQVCADPETETLKKHTARLEEQLSEMRFSGESAESPTVSVQIPHVPPVVIHKELAENAARVLEMSQIVTPEPPPFATAEPAKLVPPAPKLSLEDEELKIPAWLEPLARNAAAPSSTQELIEREKTKRLSEQPKAEEVVAETVTPVEEVQQLPELPLQLFGDAAAVGEEKTAHEVGKRSSSKVMPFAAIAAGVLLVAGGSWWFLQQRSSGFQAAPAQPSSVPASAPVPPVSISSSVPQESALPQTNLPAQPNHAALTNTSVESNSGSNTPSIVPTVVSSATARNPQPTSNAVKGGAGTTASVSAKPAPEQAKKPILGEVHLATPRVTPNRRAQNAGELDPGIALSNEDQPDSNAEALNSGLVSKAKQPAAPVAQLPVGGDVKQAKLIFSVSPVYPMLAKSQRVSGNVQVDALIDANGRVTTMKVVSGPALLHQAAMDALRQWKYQPATLDGKPVPMHLTVTLQFRLP